MDRSARRRRARTVACGLACALAVLATPAPDASRAEQDGGTPPPPPPVGPQGPGHALEYAVLEPSFVGQRAKVAVRCRGVKPHPQRHRTVARFWIELHNTTDDELALLDDSLYVDWARKHRTPEQGVEATRVRGATALAPGEASRVRAMFLLPHDEPEEVHLLRLRGTVSSDAGAKFLLRPVFERAGRGVGGRFHFAPDHGAFRGLGTHRLWR